MLYSQYGRRYNSQKTVANPAKSSGRLSIKQNAKPALYGLLCACLTIGIVLCASALYYNEFYLKNNNNYGNSPYFPQEVWLITYIATIVLLGLFTATGLPYILGRMRGLRQVCKIFLFEMFFLLAGLLVSGPYISTLYTTYENNDITCNGGGICGENTFMN